MKSIFEEMGGTYRQEGDYLIPNLVLPDTSDYKIGKYGRMCRSYLKEHRPSLYSTLVLDEYCSNIWQRSTKLATSVWKLSSPLW